MRALITGVTGQDGALLSRFLLNKGYAVFGLTRRTSAPTDWRLVELGVYKNPNFQAVSGDVTDIVSLNNAINIARPDEIYNLAAQSYVAASWTNPIMTWNSTCMGAINVFEAARAYEKDRMRPTKIKIYQASSSEMLGGEMKQHSMNESEQFCPRSPYAAAKCGAHYAAQVNRASYNQFISCGILFNHESRFRGEEFVTRKITKAVAMISKNQQERVALGNIESVRDWGSAEDFVQAMWLMLQQDRPDDFVIATGKCKSVEYLCQVAFKQVGLNWEKYVTVSKEHMRPADVKFLCGDYSKAKSILGWQPSTSFVELIRDMVNADLERLRK